MSAQVNPLLKTLEMNRKIGEIFQERTKGAQQRLQDRIKAATEAHALHSPAELAKLGAGVSDYATDLAQRAILFWSTLHQRGDQFIEHHRAGLPPVLHFAYETVLDARSFAQPVNYALLRITPPKGVVVDNKRRPYVVIDPRAGHGPGIGGFKNDSQVGVALQAGHPVYFVSFFQQPEPGQTLLDVCEAEVAFIKKVRELHPDSPKPVLVGNCQGGWAAMMAAAADPETSGPIVINGAPMSYWGGAWEDGDNDNPMRYAGGLLGGTWLSSMVADMSKGVFDGAWLVDNFEKLNPSNTFWQKYYHLFANVDSEAPRFLEFERWWGGMYLMNREEIEWITQNLFVGNKLWTGGVKTKSGKAIDLRNIRAPIVLFASMGDNITPPEQAFNWVADVYSSTEDIKVSGQVIVGLLHQSVGHLGIFVSGAVAKKEHTQIVSVLKSIEALPPGLYGMRILTHEEKNGAPRYEVEFVERRLEDVIPNINRFDRKDEKPFEAAAVVSEFNQKMYEKFVQPTVQAMASDTGAKLSRVMHPLRMQRWAISGLNPWLAWLEPAAEQVKAQRKSLDSQHPLRQLEAMGSEFINASLDYYRDMKSALNECEFFGLYGNLFALSPDGQAQMQASPSTALPHEQDVVQAALAQIEQGGFAEAASRIGFLLQRQGQPLPLSRLELRADLAKELGDLLPQNAPDVWRKIRGTQEIIARFEPAKALASLPKLLAVPEARQRMLKLLDAVLADERIQNLEPTPAQTQMLAKIQRVLDIPQKIMPKPVSKSRPAPEKSSAKIELASKSAPKVIAKVAPKTTSKAQPKTPLKSVPAVTSGAKLAPRAKPVPASVAKSIPAPVAKKVVAKSAAKAVAPKPAAAKAASKPTVAKSRAATPVQKPLLASLLAADVKSGAATPTPAATAAAKPAVARKAAVRK